MKRPTRFTRVVVLILAPLYSGCNTTQPFYLNEDGDLSHYLDTSAEASYPDVEEASLPEATQARRPYSIADGEPHDFWDLSLEDVIAIALQNTKVVRGGGAAPSLQGWAVVGPGPDDLATGTPGQGRSGQQTVFDVAINQSRVGSPSPGRLNDNVAGRAEIGPGQLISAESITNVGGVEAALSEFDASFNTRLFWDKSDRTQNFAVFQPFVKNDSASFEAELSKKTAVGTHVFFRNTTSYEHANTNFLRPGTLLVNSAYTTAFEFEARQPLLRGRGTLVNRIAVVSARINEDQSIAELEQQLQNYLANIEVRYWDLYCAYRRFETAQKGRDSALSAWRDVQTKLTGGILAGQDEARAREQYFNFRSELESALCDLYSKESDLRWLMGLAATDDKLVRPQDQPTEAQVNLDWAAINAEAAARRPDLRSQRWQIKKNELQLAYAKNALLPELNAFGLYRFVGVGDELVGANRNGQDFAPGTAVGSRAFDELTGGNFQEASFGIEMNLPVGFRKELAGVRNAQLGLARQHALVEDMELDVSRQLAQAVRALDAQYQLAQTHLNRWMAAEEEVKKRTEVRQQLESAELDRLLDAQVRRANAQIAYYTALCEYNKLIALIHHRKGSIADYCGVQFGEGPWPEKAYFDALGHARRRDASTYLNYGWSRPSVISRGPVHGEGAGEYVEEIFIDDGMEMPLYQPTPAMQPEELDLSSSHSRKAVDSLMAPVQTVHNETANHVPAESKGSQWSELGLSVPKRQAAAEPHVTQASFEATEPAAPAATTPEPVNWKPAIR